ncbi:hypothetical protein ACS8E9_17480 [Pseudomonas neustonica]|uniref:hypothetical protein n=1 Tax=Pseudomonas neustonica TaxID=2487346 RepID=UPI003F4754C3|tara:strand:- start:2907 stop:3158 length:252 start_codon:yes stop_codon:yes gene_type:complete
MAENWEFALMAVVEREIEQLKWLVKCAKSGKEGVDLGDVHAQVDRLGGLTDLGDDGALPVSQLGVAKMRQYNAVVMDLVRQLK